MLLSLTKGNNSSQFSGIMDDRKRTRKPNWCKSEIASLIEAVSLNQRLILNKFRSTDSNRKKQLAWNKIANSVCAQSDSVARTVEEVKKKWKDLVSQAKRDVHARKHTKTGGGPKPAEGEFTSLVVDIFGANNPVFHGIEEGGESGNSHSSIKSSQAETSVVHMIPVQPGVPFSQEDMTIVVEAKNTHTKSASSKPPQLRSSTPTSVVDDTEALEASVTKPTPPPRTPPPQRTLFSSDSQSTTGKQKVINQVGPNTKAGKGGQARCEDLLQLELEKTELEKEKLSAEIIKLRAETEKLRAERRKIEKEEELLDLQIQAARKQVAKSEDRRVASRVPDVILHCSEKENLLD